MKIEPHVETQEEPPAPRTQTPAEVTPQPTPEAPRSEGRRSARSSRASVVTYNVQILAGTAIHTPSKYLEKHHKNVVHGSLESLVKTNPDTPPKKRGLKRDLEDDPAEAQLATESAQAERRRKSSRIDLRKEALHNLTAAGDAVGQRGPGLLSNVKSRLQNVLRIDMNDSPPERPYLPIKPVLKRARSSIAAEAEDEVTEKEQEKVYTKPKTKQWMKQGLFVGQHREFDPRFSESQNRNRRRSKKGKDNDILPLPMFGYERNLNDPNYKRDFKLPFDVYHPLPRKIKVDGWVKLHKSKLYSNVLFIV
jgi:palmitoyltransferase ZDHHC9/14/18